MGQVSRDWRPRACSVGILCGGLLLDDTQPLVDRRGACAGVSDVQLLFSAGVLSKAKRPSYSTVSDQ